MERIIPTNGNRLSDISVLAEADWRRLAIVIVALSSEPHRKVFHDNYFPNKRGPARRSLKTPRGPELLCKQALLLLPQPDSSVDRAQVQNRISRAKCPLDTSTRNGLGRRSFAGIFQGEISNDISSFKYFCD
jgi:hypothetical protein